MKYELKKLLANQFAVLLCIGLILANAFYFYHYALDDSDGYSQRQVKEKYEQRINLAEEMSELEQILAQTDLESTADDALITGDAFTELALDREVFRQITDASEYGKYLDNKITEIRARLNAGLLGSDGSFAYRAHEEVAKRYQALEGLRVEPSFYGHIEVLTTGEVTDLFLFTCILIGGLLLFSDDRHSGILLLLRPTVRGKGNLYFRKLFALLLFSSTVLLLFYSANILLCAMLFGFENLSLPIQGVPGFLSCPFPYTVFGFLLRAALEKLLWVWELSSLVALLCTCTNSPVGASALCMGAGLVSFLLGAQSNLWLQSLSLIKQRAVSDRYQQCMMLNFFGKPMAEPTAFLIIGAAIFAGSVAVGLVCFVKRDAVVSLRRRRIDLPIGNHTNLFRHESYKLLIGQKGILCLIALCLLQWSIYKNTVLPRSSHEYYLSQYSQILNGAVSEEKAAFLSAEAQRFEDIHTKIDNYYAHSQDPVITDYLTADLKIELQAEKAFETAKLQYDSLSPGQSYVHPTGYNYLFGRDGIAGDLKSLLLLEIFLILSLSGIFVREHETSVFVLQTTIGATQRVARKKVLLSLLFALILTVVSFLPQILLVSWQYGIPERTATANSLRIFSDLSGSFRIWHIFLMSWAARISVAALSVGMIHLFSKKAGTLTISILSSAAVLILPVAIALAAI